MTLCEQYYEGDAVQACCEDCRQVHCPRVIDVLFASPKGGSVEETPKNYGANCSTSVSPTHSDGPRCLYPRSPIAHQSDYL